MSERAGVIAEFEHARASALRIAAAAHLLKNETVSLEWALWATDPDIDHGNFNHAYAAVRLRESIPAWRAARDALIFELEQSAEALREASDE